MALLTTYTAASRSIDQGLMVTYSKTRTFQSYTYIYGVSQEITINSEWEYHRNASKSYKYGGMSYIDAKACAAAMTTYYTRQTRTSVWNSSGAEAGTFTTEDGGSQVMAQIAIVHTGGSMFEVQISVTESDARISTQNVSAETLFTAENARTYDEEV